MALAFPTMVTPYNRDGSIDFGAVDALVDWYAARGCGGVFAACQSSEIFRLTEDERAALAARVTRRAEGTGMTVVASGHVSDSFADQTRELRRVAESGCAAVILISNRLDVANTGDAAWLGDLARLREALPDVPLGVYECPYPYKRLLTPAMLDGCAQAGFRFIKDTCCDADVIAARLRQLDGTGVALYNANAQTLLRSLRDGAAGYCGVMANFHPALYVWLCREFAARPEAAERVQAALGMMAFTESLAYPCTAKYHLDTIAGVPMGWTSRVRDAGTLTEYQRDCIRQMDTLARSVADRLGRV